MLSDFVNVTLKMRMLMYMRMTAACLYSVVMATYVMFIGCHINVEQRSTIERGYHVTVI